MKMKNIPNMLSAMRILLVFLFVYVFFEDYPSNNFLAIIVFITAGVTDVIDGFIARRFNCISNLGKILDPLADKMMQCAVLVSLFIKNLIPIWLLILYISKEVLIGVASLCVLKRKKVYVVSNKYGKIAVCIFYASMFTILMFGEKLLGVPFVIDIISGITLASAFVAITMYCVEYLKANKKTSKSKGLSSELEAI